MRKFKTTQAFISSFSSNPLRNGSVETEGFYEAGDGGGGRWVYTNVTSLTPSQTPAQRVNAEFLNDASGNQWAIKPEGALRLESVGAVAGGVTNNDAVFAAATASSFTDFTLGSGTFGCTRLPLKSFLAFSGQEDMSTILKLIDSGNSTVVYGLTVTDVVLRNFKVDGNKANQTLGSASPWRGVYFLGACHDLLVENVIVNDIQDHGIFFSDGGIPANECGKNSVVRGCRAINVGSAAHLAAAGPGGSGIVGGHSTTVFESCYATLNYLNGFKSLGSHSQCYSYSNLGGGFETGFGTNLSKDIKYSQCFSIDNATDGWRNQSEGVEMLWSGCTAKRNGGSGIMFLNNVDRATVEGCYFVNNGQLSNTVARTATRCHDGISFSTTSGAPSNITVTGSHFFDDQATKTQEYHMYFNGAVDGIDIDSSNNFGVAKTQPLFFESSSLAGGVSIGNAKGLSSTFKTTASSIVTGTTSLTDINTTTIDASSFPAGLQLEIKGSGNISGTTAQKLLRFDFAGSQIILANLSAAQVGDYFYKIEIMRLGTELLINYESTSVAGVLSGTFSPSLGSSASITLKSTGQLVNSADNITEKVFTLKSV